jgi:hypothetical protein
VIDNTDPDGIVEQQAGLAHGLADTADAASAAAVRISDRPVLLSLHSTCSDETWRTAYAG